FFFSSRRRHTRFSRDWSSDVCSSDLTHLEQLAGITELLGRVLHAQRELSLQQLQQLLVQIIGALRAKFASFHGSPQLTLHEHRRSEERRVGKECRSLRWQEH